MEIGFYILLSLIGLSIIAYIGYSLLKKKQITGNDNFIQEKDKNDQAFDDKFKDLHEDLNKQREDFIKVLNELKDKNQNQGEKFIKEVTTLQTNLTNFQDNLTKKDANLKQDWTESSKAVGEKITNLIKDVTELRSSSKTLTSLDENVKNIQNIFLNSKKRGNLGEYLLETILNDVYGESGIWETQHQLPSGQIIDAYINLPEGKEGIAIDSKFPIDNYNKHLETQDKNIQQQYLQAFKRDFKARIDEVAKYIKSENDISSAIMFVPSENIFSFIYGQYPEEVISYALKKKVWLTSPTTLSAVLFIIYKHTKELKLNQEAEVIRNELIKFKGEWERWIKRWDQFKIVVNRLPEKVKNLDTTNHKINKSYEKLLVNHDVEVLTNNLDVINQNKEIIEIDN